MTACPHTILKSLKRESNNQLCLALYTCTKNLYKHSGVLIGQVVACLANEIIRVKIYLHVNLAITLNHFTTAFLRIQSSIQYC